MRPCSPMNNCQDAAQEISQAIGQALELQIEGRLDEAEAAFKKILQAHPGHADAVNLSGMLSYQRRRVEEAAERIAQAIAADGANAAYFANQAMVLATLDRTDEVEASLRRALELDPGNTSFLLSLGNTLQRQGKTGEAEACFRQTMELRPDFLGAYNNLGVILEAQGRHAEAEACYKRALEAGLEEPPVLLNLGNALRDQHRPDEAIAAYGRAIELKPDFAQAHVNMSYALLMKGDFEAGWKEFEWRWKVENFPTPLRPFAQQPWDGTPLSGETVLVHAEQGFGDTLQFARYTAAVADRGGRVVVECQPELRRLMATAPGVAGVVAHGETLPEFDRHVPLLSLPGLLNTTLQSIPADTPYLRPDPRLAEEWAGRMAGGGRKVGIVWRSSLGQLSSPHKSCPLTAFAPLFELPGVRLFSLQKDPPADDLPLPGGVGDLGGRLDDFADTAAVISSLDLTISVDTAVAHLAGALGRPVWLLLSTAGDWRWLTGREDSPWYPTMRLFRQPSPGDWQGVLQRTAAALVNLDISP